MPLGINTNLSSQGIIKNLEASQAQFQKSVNRLSTGLRINGAADDPAGLINAQKYQSQVNGLGQAIANARDAVNLVQTAEGAMDQITTQLQSMRTLALHAANAGVNDANAQAADQAQIKLALESIDRIVNNTQFGTKKLLDGSAGVSGVASDPNTSFAAATSATKAGTYTVQVSQVATQGQAAGVALKQVAVTGNGGTVGETAGAGATLKIDTAGGALASVSATSVTLDVSNMKLDQVVSAVNEHAALRGKVVASKTDDGKNLVIKTAQTSTVTATNEADDLAVIFDNGGGGDKFGLDDDAGAGTQINATSSGGGANDAQALVQASDSALTKADETLTFTDGGSKTVAVLIKGGTTLAAAVSQTNSALSNAGIGVTASLSSGGRFTVTNNAYGDAAAVGNTVASSKTNAVANNGLGLVSNVTGGAIATGTNMNSSVAGVNVAGTINGHAATGSGQVLSGGAAYDEAGLQVKYSGSSVPVGNNAGTITVTNSSLSMQLGAFAGQTATVGISSMATADLGKTATGTTILSGSNVKLSNIDVSSGANGAGAADALRIIDAALSQVSSQRAALGAFQTQTLEATVRTSQVAQNNLTTTLSDIQDANMAQESTSFSRAQILQQQSVSMLAQANQSSQLLLRLFQ